MAKQQKRGKFKNSKIKIIPNLRKTNLGKFIKSEYDNVKMSDDENRRLTVQVGANDQENRENFHPNKQENQVQANTPQSQLLQFVSKTKLKVTVKSWNGVASWKWIANDDTCGICRVAFDGCCPDCKSPGDDCPLVWGACTHCFHIHCIMKWLQTQQTQHLCPMCRQEWRYSS